MGGTQPTWSGQTGSLMLDTDTVCGLIHQLSCSLVTKLIRMAMQTATLRAWCSYSAPWLLGETTVVKNVFVLPAAARSLVPDRNTSWWWT